MLFLLQCDEIKAQADANQLGLVQTYQTPCDVVQNSDVIFSCLADPRSAKEVTEQVCRRFYIFFCVDFAFPPGGDR
jgi:3-hydroxyisobutyrate dehydrogenase-like beta-hydroxyacid dehydrogenase